MLRNAVPTRDVVVSLRHLATRRKAARRLRCHKGKYIKLWLIEINMTDILKKYQIFLLFINNCEYLCAKLIKTNYFL